MNNVCNDSAIFIIKGESTEMEEMIISDNKFENNLGYNGGALFINEVDCVVCEIRDCTFIKNRALNYGGAIFLEQAENLIVKDNVYLQNQSLKGILHI